LEQRQGQATHKYKLQAATNHLQSGTEVKAISSKQIVFAETLDLAGAKF